MSSVRRTATYLAHPSIEAALTLLARVPESPEHVYQRPMGDILRFIFPVSGGYDVVIGADAACEDTSHHKLMGLGLDLETSTYKVCRTIRRQGRQQQQQQSGGMLFSRHDVMLVESRMIFEPWEVVEDQLRRHLAGNGCDSKRCYGMIQIGLMVQLYKYEPSSCFTKVGGRMHLINNHRDVIEWGRYVKEHPLSIT